MIPQNESKRHGQHKGLTQLLEKFHSDIFCAVFINHKNDSFIIKISLSASMLREDKTFYQSLVRAESHSQPFSLVV
ncbi:hypothetical protein KIF59_01120 [Enterobacter cloacae subsp. cloacae]|nr:hypothetical protein [Enterobacter cloacae subsp. cloacae]